MAAVAVAQETKLPELAPEPTHDELVDDKIADANVTVKIDVPGSKMFELQLSLGELVNDLRGYITDREDCCQRTCFSLQLDGVPLDHFAELRSVEGLTDGVLLKVVEEPYTIREARLHVRHVRDLTKSLDWVDAMNGLNGASMSYLNTITEGEINPKNESDFLAPKHVQISSEPLFEPLFPGRTAEANCLSRLAMSMWNPPPNPRRLRGDLLYLSIKTNEGRAFEVTASPRGFYVNKSTIDEFDPTPASVPYLSHSLVDLLSQLSPAFKKGWSMTNKKRCSLHPFERLPTNFQLFSWLAPKEEHQVDCVRAEDAYTARSTEEHIPGQTREWNEELQAVRELPVGSIHERLLRDRAFFKVHSDFVSAATRGAMLVVDGGVLAINPGDEPRSQMFIWSNIFFSLGFDVREHYGNYGGDAAAFVAPLLDLKGVQVYNQADVKGLHTLGTVIVDYKGFRVTAQSIIPGILEREQEQSVVYGSIDFGKTIVSHEDYDSLLEQVAKTTKQQVHKAKNSDGKEVTMYTSVETKGIQGNDKRNYVLDLLRTMPPDVNFLADSLSKDDLSLFPETMKDLHLPRTHTHKLAAHRHELVEAFCENRYLQYWKLAMKNFAEAKKELDAVEDLDEDAKKQKLMEKNTESIKEAASAVGSISTDELDIRFNPDIFSSTVDTIAEEGEIRRQKQLIVDVASFLVNEQIPAFVKECKEGSENCLDCVSMVNNLHHKGIGVRYLGVIQKALLAEEDPNLEHVMNTVNAEMISRAIKWIFRNYLQKADQSVTGQAVAHLLNCLFASCPVQLPQINDDINGNPDKSNKKKKKGKKNAPKHVEPSTSVGWKQLTNQWMSVTPEAIWRDVEKRARSYFHVSLNCKSIDEVCNSYKIQKASLLRDVCLKNGIQIHLRNYDLTSKNKLPFTDEDIMSMFPIVKHLNPKAADGNILYQKGQHCISQGYMKDGQIMIQEALGLFTSVYGNVHADVISSYRLLARLDYIQGNHTEAIEKQHKACLLSERCHGLDSPSTIQEYITLAHYCFATNQVPASLKLLYRARYLLKLIHGERHPEMATIDTNIGLVLYWAAQFDAAEGFFKNALNMYETHQPKNVVKQALSNHLIARVLSFKSNFREAILHEKEACKTYRSILGDEHEKTKESTDFLKHLTQQAVSLQKTMNAMKNKENVKANLPVPCPPPQHRKVLETMNVANGIFFADGNQLVHIVTSRQREQIKRIEKAEMEREMKLIAKEAGASDDQVQQAMKLAKGVLPEKEEQIEEEQLD